jgi:hypothetical protein
MFRDEHAILDPPYRTKACADATNAQGAMLRGRAMGIIQRQRGKPLMEVRAANSVRPHNEPIGIRHIAEALIACGYTSLDEQAKALGLNRSTAWTIVKAKHKLGRLSAKTSRRILANPQLPAPVRAVIQQYLIERTTTCSRIANSD